MNYATVVSNVLIWANKPEIEQAIPTFLTFVDADLKRRLAEAGVSAGEGRDTATLETGDEYSVAPPDLGRIVRMRHTSDGDVIENVTQAGFEARYAVSPELTGKPLVFTLVGTEFRYYPIPDDGYEVELVYQRRIASLTSSATTNWISDNHPDIYLYGCLWQAGLYLHDDKMIDRNLALYEGAVAGAITAERAKRGSPRASGYRANLPLSRDPGGYNPNPDL